MLRIYLNGYLTDIWYEEGVLNGYKCTMDTLIGYIDGAYINGIVRLVMECEIL